jgi:carbon-monoxide dehydrogenase medium subunit
VKPAPFRYVAPSSVDELTRIVAEREDIADTAILAGGQSLMPLMALRYAQPTCLVDINGLAGELGRIGGDGDGLRVGALVRQRAAERDPGVAERVPLLAEALPSVAKPAVRTRGTVGGSLCYADAAAEIPLVAVALDAVMTAAGPRGDRAIPAREFFVGAYENALEVDEFLSGVTFRALPEGSGSSFLEISPRHADRAIIGVAAVVSGERGRVTDVRLALAGVAPTPVRATRAERTLGGQAPDPDAIAAAAQVAADDIDPDSDLPASADYRRHAAAVLVRRALQTAIGRAGGIA